MNRSSRRPPRSVRARTLAALLPLLAVLAGCDLFGGGGGTNRVVLQLRLDGDGRLRIGDDSYRSDARLEFARGSRVEILPLPDDGNGFAAWGGACDGAPREACTLTLDADATVEATFVVERPVELTLDLSGDGSGTVSVDGEVFDTDATVVVAAGIPVTLVAGPATGSIFAGWGGACADQRGTADCTIAIDAPATVEATFIPATGSVAVRFGGDGAGAVLAENGGGLCTADCTLAASGSVALRAAAALGSVFGGWQDCDATDGDRCTLDPLGEATVTFAATAETALGPLAGDCDGAALDATCSVPIVVHAPQGRAMRGAEFVVESDGFVLTGADLGSLATASGAGNCLIAAGPQKVVLACNEPVTLSSGAEIALVTLERRGALPTFVEVRETFFVYGGDDAKSAVGGGALAVAP